MKPIRVLIVDDSSFVRKMLKTFIARHPDLVAIAEAADGKEAVTLAKKENPDCIIMDIVMPGMDGLEATKQIANQHKIPIIVFSAYTQANSEITVQALTSGALDYVPKPTSFTPKNMEAAINRLLKLVAAVGHRNAHQNLSKTITKTTSPHLRQPYSRSTILRDRIIVIGASSGGMETLSSLLPQFPANTPAPVLVTQHIPASYEKNFAAKLGSSCKMPIRIPDHGTTLEKQKIYLAPGGRNIAFTPSGKISIEQNNDQMQLGKPNIDLAFSTAAATFGRGVIAILLSGMGRDGQQGVREIAARGGSVIVQDPKSAKVPGMPSAAIETGLVDWVLPLSLIPARIGALLSATKRHQNQDST